jgi:hypothetical protein
MTEHNGDENLGKLLDFVTEAYKSRTITQSVETRSDGTVHGVLHIPTKATADGAVKDAFHSVMAMHPLPTV